MSISRLRFLPVIFQICNRVMALDICQNFVSAQYFLEQIEWISPNFVYAYILTRYRLGLLPVIFRKFVAELLPLIYARLRFRSISLEQMDRTSPNFVCAFILTRSGLGLLPVIFFIICSRVMALYICQNFVSTQYLELGLFTAWKVLQRGYSQILWQF